MSGFSNPFRPQEGGFLRIVVRLEPTDPGMDPEGYALEGTRDDIQRDATNNSKVTCISRKRVPDKVMEDEDQCIRQHEREQRISDKAIAAVEQPLAQLAHDWAKKTEELAKTATSKLVIEVRARCMVATQDAADMRRAAFKRLNEAWTKHAPALQEELAKLYPKVIVEVVWRAYQEILKKL